jgi:hypothetical protein
VEISLAWVQDDPPLPRLIQTASSLPVYKGISEHGLLPPAPATE